MREKEPTISQKNPEIEMWPMRLVFAGILLYVLDFRIGGWNLLPDFAGYLLIFIAMRKISKVEPGFRGVMVCSSALCVISFTELYRPSAQRLQFSADLTYSHPLWGIASIFLSVFLVFQFCRALGRLAHANACPDLEDACRVTRWYYILARASILLAPLCGWMASLEPFVGVILLTVLTGLGFSGELFFLAVTFKSFHSPRKRKE